MRPVTLMALGIILSLGLRSGWAGEAHFDDIPTGTTYFSPSIGISNGVQFQIATHPGNPLNTCCAAVDTFGMIGGSNELLTDSQVVHFQLGSATTMSIDYAFPKFQGTAVEVSVTGGPVIAVQDIAALAGVGGFSINGSSHQGTLSYGGTAISSFSITGTDLYLDNLSYAAADYDGDGDVDGDDFLRWQAAFGCNSGCRVDADGDDDTDGDDFLAWQAEFGSGVAAASNAVAVPEPVALILALVACCGLVAARRRK